MKWNGTVKPNLSKNNSAGKISKQMTHLKWNGRERNKVEWSGMKRSEIKCNEMENTIWHAASFN